VLLVAVAAIAFGGAGCGSDAPGELAPATVAAPPPAPPPTQVVKKQRKVKLDCSRSRRAPAFRMCWRDGRNLRATIERRQGDSWTIIAFEPRGEISYGAETGTWDATGQWSALWMSPDGKTLLAQWSGMCETRYAYFVPADGGKPKPVTGNPDPQSVAMGFEADGRARVDVIGWTGCSDGGWKPGEYLIDPASGEATFLHS